MSRPIIAFTGLAGSGKSTAAQHLWLHHKFQRIRFAGPLKDMARAIGLNDREVDGDLKERPSDLINGMTPRRFMQLLGTEFGRDMIDPDLWVRLWSRSVDQVPAGVGVTVDDCRFINEATWIRAASCNALIVRINRRGIQQGSHISELGEMEVDATIDNDGSIDAFIRAIDHLVICRHLNAVKVA